MNYELCRCANEGCSWSLVNGGRRRAGSGGRSLPSSQVKNTENEGAALLAVTSVLMTVICPLVLEMFVAKSLRSG